MDILGSVRDEPFDPGEEFGPCRLCLVPAELQESHVVPRFVIAWLRKTGSRFLRGALNPNLRKQDGPKFHWLCTPCEQRLGLLEDSFARKVFRPWLLGEAKRFQYGSDLYDFCLSVLWRGLLASKAPPHLEAHCERARGAWRTRLQDPSAPTPEIHLALTRLTPLGAVQPVANVNRYFTRGVDVTLAGTPEADLAFMFVRFARFMLFGAIRPFDFGAFVGTRILPGGGTLDSQGMRIEDVRISHFLLDRAAEANQRRETGLTAKQRAVIRREAMRDRARLAGTPLMAAIRADEAAIVDPEMMATATVGRNDQCPCGRGFKFKRCHGK